MSVRMTNLGNSPKDVLVMCLESALSTVLKSVCMIFLNGQRAQHPQPLPVQSVNNRLFETL